MITDYPAPRSTSTRSEPTTPYHRSNEDVVPTFTERGRLGDGILQSDGFLHQQSFDSKHGEGSLMKVSLRSSAKLKLDPSIKTRESDSVCAALGKMKKSQLLAHSMELQSKNQALVKSNVALQDENSNLKTVINNLWVQKDAILNEATRLEEELTKCQEQNRLLCLKLGFAERKLDSYITDKMNQKFQLEEMEYRTSRINRYLEAEITSLMVELSTKSQKPLRHQSFGSSNIHTNSLHFPLINERNYDQVLAKNQSTPTALLHEIVRDLRHLFKECGVSRGILSESALINRLE